MDGNNQIANLQLFFTGRGKEKNCFPCWSLTTNDDAS